MRRTEHSIEVDEGVFEALQDLATPLVDTPSSVLRRLLLEEQRGRVARDRLTVDVKRDRLRELDWSTADYRREV